MDIIVEPKGWLIAGSTHYRCSLGRAGIVTDKEKVTGQPRQAFFRYADFCSVKPVFQTQKQTAPPGIGEVRWVVRFPSRPSI